VERPLIKGLHAGLAMAVSLCGETCAAKPTAKHDLNAPEKIIFKQFQVGFVIAPVTLSC